MGNYPSRLPESLMQDARDIAKSQGVSVNQLLSTVIAERVGELKALERIRQRVRRADPAAAAAILALVPDREPLLGDELPEE